MKRNNIDKTKASKAASIFPSKPAANHAKKQPEKMKKIFLGLNRQELMFLFTLYSSLHLITKHIHELPELEFYPAISEYKSIENWKTFYLFYLTQHSDVTCRRLHIIGTTLSLVLIFSDFTLILAAIPAVQIAYIAMHCTKCLDNGLIEMALFFLTFLGVSKYLKGSITRPLLALVVGYAFAWIGHFFFELNKPATFVYPIYSFAGDLRLWYETVIGKHTF